MWEKKATKNEISPGGVKFTCASMMILSCGFLGNSGLHVYGGYSLCGVSKFAT